MTHFWNDVPRLRGLLSGQAKLSSLRMHRYVYGIFLIGWLLLTYSLQILMSIRNFLIYVSKNPLINRGKIIIIKNNLIELLIILQKGISERRTIRFIENFFQLVPLIHIKTPTDSIGVKCWTSSQAQESISHLSPWQLMEHFHPPDYW